MLLTILENICEIFNTNIFFQIIQVKFFQKFVFQASRRSDWVDDEIDEKDLEYYLWRKRRRQYLRTKAAAM